MQIAIKNHGPLKDKVTITIDGDVIVFPTCAFVKLENLMVAIGATPDGPPAKGEAVFLKEEGKAVFLKEEGESHWTLDLDPIRESAYRCQLAHAKKANEGMASEISRLEGHLEEAECEYDRVSALLADAVKERQALQSAHWWTRLKWALRSKK